MLLNKKHSFSSITESSTGTMTINIAIEDGKSVYGTDHPKVVYSYWYCKYLQQSHLKYMDQLNVHATIT